MQGPTGKILAIALMLGVAGCASSDRTEAGVVKVIRVKGTARYSVDQREWHSVKKDTQFKAGVLIQTGPKTMVDIWINEGHPNYGEFNSEATTDHVIRLYENTALKLTKFTKQAHYKWFSEDICEDIQFDLVAGQTMGNVGALSPKSTYEIKIPKGRMEIRGGMYMVSSGGVLGVLRGSVFAIKANADGSETRTAIGSQQSFDFETGAINQWAEHSEIGIFPGEKFPPDPAFSSGVPHGSGMGGALRKFQ